MSSKSISVSTPTFLGSAIGARFGRLTVRRYSHKERKRNNPRTYEHFVICDCQCGATGLIKRFRNLREGVTRSCGCLKREHPNHFKHGAARSGKWSPEYRVWISIKTRCFNANDKSYQHYGAKGIAVHPRWLGEHGFTIFLRDDGARPSLADSLDRYPERHGNYEPNNVRWASRKQQALNRDRTKMLTLGSVSMCVSDWAIQLGVTAGSLREWISRHGETAFPSYVAAKLIKAAA